MKSNLKKKKNMELEFHVKFLTLLDFHQIEFQNKDILLDSFRIGAFCYIFWAKGANAHFGQINFLIKQVTNKLFDYALRDNWDA